MGVLLFYKINYLIVIFCSCGLVIFLLQKKIKKDFFFFLLLNISLIIWAVGRYGLLVSEAHSTALFWAHILYVGSIFIYLFFLHFIYAFLGNSTYRRYVLGIFYINALFLSWANLSDLFFGTTYFLADVEPKLFFSFYEVPGKFYFLQLLSNLLIPAIAVVEMIREYRHSFGIKRGQLRYLILASFLGFSGGGTILFLIYNIPIQPFGVLLVVVQFLATGYAITRYRLIGVRVIAEKIIVYSFLLLFFTASFSAIKFITEKCAIYIPWPEFFDIFASVAFFISSFSYLDKKIESLVNKFLFKSYYDYKEVAQRISGIIVSNIDFNLMLNQALTLIAETLKVNSVSFLLLNEEFKKMVLKGAFHLEGENSSMNLDLDEKHPIVKYLSKSRGVIIAEELRLRLSENGMGDLVDVALAKKMSEKMAELNLYICQPIFKNEKLLAVVCFGNKLNGDIFDMDDIKLLDSFANQLSLAIENFIAYEEIKSKKEQLEKSMKLMVGRELEMINMKKELSQLKKTSL